MNTEQTEAIEEINIAEIRRIGVKYAPDSSTLKHCVYDPSTSSLLIDFHGGGPYLYTDIDFETWDGLVRAKSAGTYFAKHVRNNFKFKRVVTDGTTGKEVLQK